MFRCSHPGLGQKFLISLKRHEKSSIRRKPALFRANYHVSAFSSISRPKLAKSCSFREKVSKIIDLAETSHRSSKLACFGIFFHLFGQKLQKLAYLVKKREKSSIRRKLSTFQAKKQLSAFSSIFKPKVGKSSSFREKAWKIIDLAETSNFLKKLACIGVFMKFSGKTCWFREKR